MRLSSLVALTALPLLSAPAADISRVADAYVKLVLAVGRHDASFVDAYYGPAEWKAEPAQGTPLPLADLLARARGLQKELEPLPTSERRTFLQAQLRAVEGFLRRLSGERLSLKEEARLLYDIDLPTATQAQWEAAHARLERLVPGAGPLEARVSALKARFFVPGDRLPALSQAALKELRRRTAAILPLPKGEDCRLEFVTKKPWGGYNWYLGGLQSLIQVNTDLPMPLDRVLGLLAHEGYPGHHVYNSLLEQDLVKGKGWREFTVYPLNSPQSLVAEGTANAALDMVMSHEEQRDFTLKVLAPLAGLDTKDLDRYLEVQAALGALKHVRGVAAGFVFDQGRPEAEATAFLGKWALESPERAAKSMEFARVNRAYVFTYTVGQDLVEAYAGKGKDRVARFVGLLRRPITPTELKADARP